MEPVEQTTFYDAADSTRGNCLAACVASIFELPLTECPIPAGGTWGDVEHWTQERWPWLAVAAQYLDPAMQGERRVRGDEFLAPVYGYWIASVESPRITIDGEPGLHAVVMHGSELAWDPHPRREQGFGLYSSAGWWYVPDPAKLAQ